MNMVDYTSSKFAIIDGLVWEEERYFVFIDLNESTRLAEMLGNRRFSELLSRCLIELHPLVYKYSGSIYQIVGDEIVLTWSGDVPNAANCLVSLVFEFFESLEKNHLEFVRCFGVIPGFKAAANFGFVAVSENPCNGEVFFRGDVLNTCGGMIPLCKKYDSKFLATGSFVEQVKSSFNVQITFQGMHAIKQKLLSDDLYSIKKTEHRKIKVLL